MFRRIHRSAAKTFQGRVADNYRIIRFTAFVYLMWWRLSLRPRLLEGRPTLTCPIQRRVLRLFSAIPRIQPLALRLASDTGVILRRLWVLQEEVVRSFRPPEGNANQPWFDQFKPLEKPLNLVV